MYSIFIVLVNSLTISFIILLFGPVNIKSFIWQIIIIFNLLYINIASSYSRASKPSLFKASDKCLYHSLGDCLRPYKALLSLQYNFELLLLLEVFINSYVLLFLL